LSAIGFVCPNPAVDIRAAATPCVSRYD
jgi:hypothetical protein